MTEANETHKPLMLASIDGVGPPAERTDFANRCTLAANCLPSAEYRTRLERLHDDMLAEIRQLRHALVRSGKLAEDRLQQMRADRAEFLKLRSKISGAPVAIMDTREALCLCAPTEADFPALYALQGRGRTQSRSVLRLTSCTRWVCCTRLTNLWPPACGARPPMWCAAVCKKPWRCGLTPNRQLGLRARSTA